MIAAMRAAGSIRGTVYKMRRQTGVDSETEMEKRKLRVEAVTVRMKVAVRPVRNWKFIVLSSE